MKNYIFGGLLTVFVLFLSCEKEVVAIEQDPLSVDLVEAWLSTAIPESNENRIYRNQIQWDWEGLQRKDDNVITVKSKNASADQTEFELEVAYLNGEYKAVVYFYIEAGLDTEGNLSKTTIAVSLNGDILYSKNPTMDSFQVLLKKGRLTANGNYGEDGGGGSGGGSPQGFVWNSTVGAYVLANVTVVAFQNPSLNTRNAFTYINWANVTNFVSNNSPDSPNYYNLPSGGSGNNSSNTNWINPNAPGDEVILPPSCKSFKFSKVGNAQFAYVKGIRFLFVESSGSTEYAKYDNPIEFSTPYEDRFGNVYDNATIAEASARALNEAMESTFQYTKSIPTDIGEYRIKKYFEDKLSRIYPNHIPGGRVQIRPRELKVPEVTEYKASWFFEDDCED